MAAAAARNRTQMSGANKSAKSPEAEKKVAIEETGDISAKMLDRQPPMSIGALAAQAAREKKQREDLQDSVNRSSQTSRQAAEISECRTRSGRTEGIDAIGGNVQVSKEVETIIPNKTSPTASTKASSSLQIDEKKPHNESASDISESVGDTDGVKNHSETTQIKNDGDIEKQNIQQGKTIEELEAILNNPELDAEERKRMKRKLKKRRQKMKKNT